MNRNLTKNEEIERSIITTYRKKIWSPFLDAISEYKLISENDHILVAMSGGKDSFLLAKLFQQLLKITNIKFKVTFLVMNPGYKDEILKQIEDNLKLLEINAKIVKTDIFSISTKMGGKPCFLCARMRRGFLYKIADELGCTKLALGHHFNDVIETLLLSMFYNGKIQTMPPKLKSDNYNIELIRPLYHVKEQDIINWRNKNNLEFINCACTFTEENTKYDSKRKEVKEVIKKLKELNPIIPDNIFTSQKRVVINTMLGIEENEELISFNELYEKRK